MYRNKQFQALCLHLENYQSEVERMQQAASTTMSIQQQKQEVYIMEQSGIECFGCAVNVYQGSVDMFVPL